MSKGKTESARSTTVSIELNEEMRAALQKVERQYSTSQQVAQRVRIILLASEGKNHSQISQLRDLNRYGSSLA